MNPTFGGGHSEEKKDQVIDLGEFRVNMTLVAGDDADAKCNGRLTNDVVPESTEVLTTLLGRFVVSEY